MPSTTNFGWTTPADTDLVKDGAAAIRTLGNGIDTSFFDLKGGTTGQILSKNSGTDLDFVWIANDQGDITAVTAGTGISGGGTAGAVTITNSMATEITAKGDLIVGTGNAAFDNLPAGTNGHVLTADSTVSPTGLKWAAPASSSGPAFRANRTANYSISQNTWTKVNYNEEDFDTAGNYDPTTNFRFTPTTAGYYQFNYEGQIVGTEGQLMTIALYKNGASYHSGSAVDISGQGYGQVSSSDLVYMNGSSDYVEVYLYTSASGANIGGNATGNVSVFSGVWIRS